MTCMYLLHIRLAVGLEWERGFTFEFTGMTRTFEKLDSETSVQTDKSGNFGGRIRETVPR